MSERWNFQDVLARLKAIEHRLDALEGGGKKGGPVEPLPVPSLPSPVPHPAIVEPVWVTPEAPKPAPDLEWRVGATWLNRLGAAAILLASAYFLSYSFAQGWITPAARCLGGGAFSLALVACGEWLRRKGQRGFSQGITGAGIGIAYVSAYAAHALYGLIGIPVAFSLMTVATALSILVAAWGSAQPVAVLGYLGGLVTPLLLRTGKDPILALTPYLLALSLGAVWQGRKRGWAAVRWLAWSGAALLLTGWTHRYLGAANRIPFTLAILALFALFQADILTRIPLASAGDSGLLALNALLATAGIYAAWDPWIPRWMGTLAVLGAVIQAWSGWRGWRRGPDHAATWTVLSHAAALLIVAVPLQFDGKGVALGWAAQVLVASWACHHHRRRELSILAVSTALLALGHLLAYELGELGGASSLASLGPWTLTTPLAACLAVGGACMIAAPLLAGIPVAAHLVMAAGSLSALSGVFAAYPSFAGTLPAWAWAGALYLVAASRWKEGRHHATAVAMVAVAKLWLWDVLLGDGWRSLAVGTPLLNLRSLSVALSAAVFAFSALVAEKPSSRVSGILLALLSLLGGISMEVHRLFTGPNPERMSMAFDERFIYTALWAFGAAGLAWLCANLPELRKAAWAFAFLLLAKFWLSDVMLRGGWEALSVPGLLASARTAAALSAAGALAVLAWRDRGAEGRLKGLGSALASVTLLGWVSLEIHRAFVGQAAEPFRLSDGERIAHSAAWALGAAAALGLGFRMDLKPLRVAGLWGIAAVTVKILLVDLSGIATVYRVGILLVLGVLSLAASWAYHRRGRQE